jgi:hypothetical protein
MLHTLTATLHPTTPSPVARSLSDRDEYGPITGRPGGLFTAPVVPYLLGEHDELGRHLAEWVPREDLL